MFLADTAGAVTVKTFLQKLEYPNPRTYVGKGKLEEIRAYIEDNDIGMAIFDDDLTSKQVVNIERELKVKILDRTSLILDIFAKRARTANAKTQVELAIPVSAPPTHPHVDPPRASARWYRYAWPG